MKTAKRLLLSAVTVLVFIIYSVQQRHESSGSDVVPTPTIATSNSSSSSTPSSAQASPTTPSTPGFKDGTYVGSEADAFYGTIQVEAIIKSGKITDVQFLQYPNDRQNSIYINSQAMPYLKQEAIHAQSAQVNTITGASDTSQAFVESLSNALAKAQIT